MKNRDLAIIKDIQSKLDATGLLRQTVIGISLETDAPLPAEMPAAAVLWKKTTESELGADGVALAAVEIEIVVRVSVEGEPSGQGKLEELIALKNELLEAVMNDCTRSGLADGLLGTESRGAVIIEKARNNFAECRVDLACDYILSNEQIR